MTTPDRAAAPVSAPAADADVHFHFDPVCPFAWITSRWLQKVVARKAYTVDWRFISLRLINSDKDYDRDFPPGYVHGHTAGLRLLRVAAAVREQVGRPAVGDVYTAAGESIFGRPRTEGDDRQWMGSAAHIAEILDAAGLPAELAAAADDDGYDAVIQAESDEALARTGRDVGTPIIVFRPPDGPAIFGPVISRVPDDDDAVALWESVIHLATFPGFAELKRSLREKPQLRSFGVEPAATTSDGPTTDGPTSDGPATDRPTTDRPTEDWKAGRRV